MLDIEYLKIIKEILLGCIGLVALAVYILQERRKVSEAASLIVIQVEELKKQIQNIGSYIVEKTLDAPAFYESQPLFKEDYWNKYKHYFVKKLDARSFTIFDEFYSCAAGILEQQQLMKSLQKNFFFVKQNVVSSIESTFMYDAMKISTGEIDKDGAVKALGSLLPQSISDENRNAMDSMLNGIVNIGPNYNLNLIKEYFSKKKCVFFELANTNGMLTTYIPDQIRVSLENAIKKVTLLEIVGCEGFRKMKQIANRRF